MSTWVKVREHIWRDVDGEPVLRHTKFLLPNGDVAFPWQTWVLCGDGVPAWLKGIRTPTPPLLYGLPELAPASRREHLWIAEGEADTDALREHGCLAVTAGAAGAFIDEHAELLRGWLGRITIVRDRDEKGAWGAVKAYDALRSVGSPASRLRVVRGRVRGKGADARDHLEAGYTVEQFLSEPIASVRGIAATTTAESFTDDGYDTPDGFTNPRTGYTILSAEELASLRGLKPKPVKT